MHLDGSTRGAPHARRTRRARHLGGLLALISIGTLAFGTMAPAFAEDDVSSDVGTELTLPDPEPLTNPDVEGCGLNVALIFDTSGSINDTELDQMKSAANGFVTALSGTPSQIALYNFDDSASQVQGFLPASDASIPTNINGIDGDGFTNWEAAFNLVAGDGAELAIILTDGNPTTHDTSGYTDLGAGILGANVVKTEGTRIVGVGIGGDLDTGNLQKISGPTENDDWYQTGFDSLGTTLAGIALKQCAGTVTVRKTVATVLTDGFVFDVSGGTGSAQQGTSGDDGTGLVNFDFQFDASSTQVTITEQVKTGFELTQQDGKNALCTVSSPPPEPIQGDAIAIVDTTNVAGGVTFELGIDDIVTCEFQNKAVEQVAGGGTTLPRTGSSSAPLAATGAGLLGLGLVAMLVSRRRRSAGSTV